MDIASLGLRIDSSQAQQAERNLDGMTAAGRRAEGQFARTARGSVNLGTALKGAIGAVAVQQFFRMADAATNIGSRLRLVTQNSQELADTQEKLFQIAQNGRTSFEGLVQTYSQIALASKELGISQQRLLGVTETISKAVALSGSSKAASQAALVQLSQGLASGTLRGEELNSVLEQTPALAQAIADGLGVSRGELRALGQAGEITAEQVILALEKMKDRVNADFQKVAITVAGSMTQLENSVLKAIGQLDSATGTSKNLAEAISSIATAVESFGNAVNSNSSAFNIIIGAGAGAVGLLAVGAAISKVTGTVMALGAFLAANPAVLALLGIGAAVGGLTAAAGEQQKFAASLEGRQKQIAALQARVEKLKAQADQTGNATDRAALLQNASRVEGLLNKAKADVAAVQGLTGNAGEAFRQMEINAQGQAKRLADAKLSKWMKEYATDAEKLKAELDKVSKDFGGKIPAEIEKRIREKFAKKGRGGKGNAEAEAAAILGFNVDALRNANQILQNSFTNQEKILESKRDNALISEKEYFAEKRRLVNTALQANEEEIAAEIRLLEAQQLKGKRDTNRDKQIADAQTKLATIRADATTELILLSDKEDAALKKVQQGFIDAENAANDYLNSLRRGQDLELKGIGAGNQERERLSGREGIQQRFDQQRLELERNRQRQELTGSFGPDAQKKYDEELDRIRRFSTAALSEFDAFYAKRLEKERDSSAGVSEALNNYFTNAQRVAQMTENVVTNAFQGMEDALVKFVQTGKLDFKSLADSIVADITRIIVKQQLAAAIGGNGGDGWLGGLMKSVFGGMFGTSSSVAGPGDSGWGMDLGRAIGGPVTAGNKYRVNEKGPELVSVGDKQYLMMGKQSGKVTPLTTPPVKNPAVSAHAQAVDPGVGGARALAGGRMYQIKDDGTEILNVNGREYVLGNKALVQDRKVEAPIAPPTAPLFESIKVHNIGTGKPQVTNDRVPPAKVPDTKRVSPAQKIINLTNSVADRSIQTILNKSSVVDASSIANIRNLTSSVTKSIQGGSTNEQVLNMTKMVGGDNVHLITKSISSAIRGGDSVSKVLDMSKHLHTVMGGPTQTITGKEPSVVGRAIGGPVAARGIYPINEKGRPELLTVAGKQYLLMGNQDGRVKEAKDAEGRGPKQDTSIYQITVAPPVGSSRETAMQWGAAAARAMSHARRRNG